MSRTVRRGIVTRPWQLFPDILLTFNKYWYKHDPTWYRRELNRKFRRQEHQYFMKFGETLRKSKNRGWYW